MTASFSIAPFGTLAADLVSALLLDLYPGASLQGDRTHGASRPGGIRVANGPLGRWMFVSTGREPDDTIAEALADGACAVVGIDSQREDFVRAVHALLANDEAYVPLALLRWLGETALQLSNDRVRVGEPPVRLTSREREILGLVAGGLTNIEIADALTISTNTVRSHLHALSVKLEATSRMKIVARARDLGFEEAAGNIRSLPVQQVSA